MHRLYFPALVTFLAGSTGCQWLAVSYHAVTYPATSTGESANVIVVDRTGYGTLAEAGLEIIDLANPLQRRVVQPPAGSESIDDLAVADGFLFVLDAREPGHLSVFDLADSTFSSPVSGPIEVRVGPFSGVSAGGGRVIVSGGTSSLALFQYDSLGKLGPEVGTIDLGRGQPDVLVSPDGRRGFVSTHFVGPYFGLTTLEVYGDSGSLVRQGEVDLDTYGFTAGGAKPANFPIEAALKENTLFVANTNGLSVIAIDTLAQPRLLRTLDIGVNAVNVDVAGNIAAVVGSAPSPLLVIVDVSDPSNPFITNRVPLPDGSYATSVSIGPEHIIVAGHKMGLLIFHLSQMVDSTGKELL